MSFGTHRGESKLAVAVCKLIEKCTRVLAAACEAASSCESALWQLSHGMPVYACAASVTAHEKVFIILMHQ